MKKTILLTVLLSAILVSGVSCGTDEETTTTKGGLKVEESGEEQVIDFGDLTEETTTASETKEEQGTTEKKITDGGANEETGWGKLIPVS